MVDVGKEISSGKEIDIELFKENMKKLFSVRIDVSE